MTLSTIPAVSGALNGKVVYVNAGHGFSASSSGAWRTDRPLTNGMVEDMGNQDQLASYADYLMNAGATVVPLRPVGHQPNEVIVDNMTPGAVTWSGSWSNSTESRYFGNASDPVSYRFATVNNSAETAVATYRPNIPVAGHYPVYTWVLNASNRTNQLYRINYAGGSQEIRVDHRRVGKGWVYLGTYYFDAGTGGSVQISNRGDGSGGSVIIADAIRFGNGMGDVPRGGNVSGRTREDEASLYWLQRMVGQGTSFSQFVTSSDDATANVSAPTRFAVHMNSAPLGQAVHLSFHSNAANGTARGTLALRNNSAGATPNQNAWADLIAREVTRDLVAIGSPPLEHPWFDRGTYVFQASFNYGEINNSFIQNAFDSTILEVAFHDNLQDAQLMRDPKVRDAVGRASYHGTLRYFNQFGGSPLVFAPGMPTEPRVNADASGNLVLRWNRPLNNGVLGDAPSGYVIEASGNGYGFSRLASVSGANTTSYTLPSASLAAQPLYFRVRAVNSGGQSMPSVVVGAGHTNPGAPRVLVVNGFTRLDRSQNIIQRVGLNYTPPSQGTLVNVERVRPRLANSFDYVVQAGDAIKSFAGGYLGFDSVQKSHVASGAVNLADYAAVVWLAGEQSTADGTFRGSEQTLVSNYVNNGGKLFVSGSELAWDLVARGNGASFYTNTLKASYVADSANTYSATGLVGSIFAGLSLTFDNGQLVYDVNSPDRIATASGSTAAMSYVGGSGGTAAVQWAQGNARVVNLAFPFETITNRSTRNAVMHRVLDFFGLAIRGDMNRDGQVNAADIAPLVAALSDTAAFEATALFSPQVIGDINRDGQFNAADIAPFVQLLLGGNFASTAAPPSQVSTRPTVARPAALLDAGDDLEPASVLSPPVSPTTRSLIR